MYITTAGSWATVKNDRNVIGAKALVAEATSPAEEKKRTMIAMVRKEGALVGTLSIRRRGIPSCVMPRALS